MSRSRGRAVAALVLAAAAAVAGAASPAGSASKPPPRTLTEPRIAEQVKPGTVLVVQVLTGTIAVPSVTFNGAMFDSLVQSDPEIRGIARTDAVTARQTAALRYVQPNPTRFMVEGPKRTLEAEAFGYGSGVIVSGDGHIVTNAHVVAPDVDDEEALGESVYEEVEEDAYAFVEDIDDTLYDGTMSVDVEDALIESYLDFAAGGSDFGEKKRSTTVLSGQASPDEYKTKGQPAEVVELGFAYPDKDVAVLKVQTSNLYSVPLGDDTDIVSGVRVFAVGYPGDATFDSGAASGVKLEPSISSGTVSARRTVEGGYSVIQHNAAIQHGSSGGPMVDDTGRIVGLTTYGSSPDESGTFSFSVPVSVVKEFLQRENVSAAPTRITEQYVSALDQFDRKHYKKALKQLQALDRSTPGLAFVSDKIAATQRRIDAGEDVSEPRVPVVLLAMGGGALLLLVLLGGGLGIGLSRRSRKRRVAAVGPAAAAPGAWAPVAPGWGNPDPTPPPGGTWGPPPSGGTPAPPGGSWPPPPPDGTPSPPGAPWPAPPPDDAFRPPPPPP